jgi:exportin-T
VSRLATSPFSVIDFLTGNKGGFEALLENMQHLAEDVSDPSSARTAFTFLGRCVTVWGQPESTFTTVNGNGSTDSHGLAGFERFIYEQLVPSAFRVPSLPQFNIKDGQMLVVSACNLEK